MTSLLEPKAKGKKSEILILSLFKILLSRSSQIFSTNFLHQFCLRVCFYNYCLELGKYSINIY